MQGTFFTGKTLHVLGSQACTYSILFLVKHISSIIISTTFHQLLLLPYHDQQPALHLRNFASQLLPVFFEGQPIIYLA